jgi:hypothetical protein
MDPRRAPQPVGSARLPDQVADLLGDRRTAASGPGLPSPKGPESLSMPANHGLWPDDSNGVHRARAEAIEPDERQPFRINIRQPQAPRRTSAQYVHLMAENRVLSSRRRDFSSDASQCSSSSILPSMRWDDDTIRDFARVWTHSMAQ